MTTYNPPIENVSIFDTLLFYDDETALTKSDADKLYLHFPNAQGKEVLKAIDVNGQANFLGNILLNDVGITQSDVNLNIQYGDQTVYQSITTGSLNTFIGSNQGISMTTAENNIFIGQSQATGLIGGSKKIAIGNNTNVTLPNHNSTIAIGYDAGNTNQNDDSTAIGEMAGQNNQGVASIAIGKNAGKLNLSNSSVAIGNNAMSKGAIGLACVAIGNGAGDVVNPADIGTGSVAVGAGAGAVVMGQYSVSLGAAAYGTENCISIGEGTGSSAGKNSIVIGRGAGTQTNTNNHNIVLNAMETNIVTGLGDDRCYIDPIRQDLTLNGSIVRYNTSTKEVYSQPANAILGPIALTSDNAVQPLLKLTASVNKTLPIDLDIDKEGNGGTNSIIGNINFKNQTVSSVTKTYCNIRAQANSNGSSTYTSTMLLNTSNGANVEQNMITLSGNTNEIQFNRNGGRSMTINTSGQVGILNSVPTEALTVTGNARINGRIFANTITDVAQLPYSKSILGNFQTINYDPTIVSSVTDLYTAGTLVGCTMNLTLGQSYTGIILQIQTASPTSNVHSHIYTTAGVLLASSSVAVTAPASNNRPFRIPFSTPFVNASASGLFFVGFSVLDADLSLTGCLNGLRNFQTPAANTFNIRSGSIVTAGIPNPLVGTLTNGVNVPFIGLY